MSASFFARGCDSPSRDVSPEAQPFCADDQACGGWIAELSDEIAEMFGELSNQVDLSRDVWRGWNVFRRKGRPERKPRVRKLRIRKCRRTGRPRGRPIGTGKNTERAKALEMLERGLSMRNVAMRVGVDRTTVRRWRDAEERKAA